MNRLAWSGALVLALGVPNTTFGDNGTGPLAL